MVGIYLFEWVFMSGGRFPRVGLLGHSKILIELKLYIISNKWEYVGHLKIMLKKEQYWWVCGKRSL